jgi:hypothetical protein
LKFEHYDLAISEVSYYGFLRGHPPPLRVLTSIVCSLPLRLLLMMPSPR